MPDINQNEWKNKWNIEDIRRDFPLLQNTDYAYLDNAATSQKPTAVLDAVRDFYEKKNANPFRGLYPLSEAATEAYENARWIVKDFINAKSTEEIIFTRNASESLNLIAYSLGSVLFRPDDEIVVSIAEHHSNMLPWRQAAERAGAKIVYLECDENGAFTEEMLRAVLTDRTRLVAITQVSNVFGRKNDIKRFAEVCHEKDIVIVADGAQSVPHMAVDVQDLDVDFLAFSGHKMLAPDGIGVLYGKKKWLKKMPPFLSGGEMIESVTCDKVIYAELPHKFEAGTVNAGGAVGLGEAIRYIQRLGFDWIEEREQQLTALAYSRMKEIPGVHVFGSENPADHHGILTFTVDGVHPHDVSEILSASKIAVRAGHHCAQPLMQHLKVGSTTRVSLAFYNTEEEILRFTKALAQVRRNMGYGE
ncbi:MAG: SufS family cysteine desulfurase [Lachnospiraceae bacterium]|nr:SufS family cysteine desulfurase [Lachnospiraceae bacterium]